MPWYEDWFDRDEYELVYEQRDEGEAEQCIDLLERVVQPGDGASVLDVGCGRGRHARILSRCGYDVTGMDLSERVIQQARERAGREGLDIHFLEGDMRHSACDACYDGVVNLFTAFGYFEEDAEHFRAVQAMASALKPGGWLFQDFLNAPQAIRSLVPEDDRVEGDTRIVQRRWVEGARLNKEITLQRNGTSQTFHESVRLLTLDDFRALYEEAGLRLVSTYGNYDGSEHTSFSPRLILYARRRA